MIEKLLKEQGKRLVVVVDDIDRLPKADIRELFKLVRLTADFPNTTYILAFDRNRVEHALSETEGDGRDYLEKILQATFDVPMLRDGDLTKFLLAELQHSLEGRVHGPFDQEDWTNIFNLAIRPLIRTPRDVRRYTNSVPVALAVVGDEIALADLLAIEAVRCLVPDVWSQIHACADVLTSTTEDGAYRSERKAEGDRARFEALLASAGKHRRSVEELCARVFPPSRRFIDNHHYGGSWTKKWRRSRRLASPELLRFYFEKSLPTDVLRAQTVHQVLEALDNETALRELVSSLAPAMVEHVCARLEVFEDEFPVETVEPALLVFHDQLPCLREDNRGFGDFGAEMAVTRLALRLLRRIADESDRETIVKRVFPRVEALSGRKELSELVGWHENAGHKLVSRAASAELEDSLRHAIVTAQANQLAEERDLFWLLRFADDGDDTIPAIVRSHAKDDGFVLRLLRSALGATSSVGLGDVAVRQQSTMHWAYLIELLGDVLLQTRVDELAARRSTLQLDERGALALDTAIRYRTGWRPSRFGDEASANPTDAGPSAAERAEARKFGQEILCELLSSVVPARRKVARDRIAHVLDRGGAIAEVVLERTVFPVERLTLPGTGNPPWFG